MTGPLLDSIRQALGREYDVERELGGGGMARVFLAKDKSLGRLVVIKVLPPDAVGSVSSDRFKREVQLAARLQHPHIVPLLTAGEMSGVPYYTMPFVEGESLRAQLAREHELPVATAVRIIREVADALDYAHGNGVVHRDIKPDNVLVSGQHALVTDFGIAKAIASARATGAAATEGITTFGVALGTPAYMAPEQASADPNVDHRADIYALGALGYELLTGHPVFTGGSPQALLAAVMTADPKPIADLRPAVPAALRSLVMRCLEKRPADRPQTAREVLTELETVGTPTGISPAASRSRSLQVFLIAAAAAFAATAFVVYRSQRSPVASSASVISVLPFVPASTDTALSRLGRDLVITVSTNLDGVGALRATDPFATLGTAGQSALSAQQATELARRFGAGSFVMGSLLREGTRVRVDFALHPADGSAPLARGTVSGPLDSISSLSDSLTWSLLRQIWRRDHPPTPSVAALTTKSILALRAYLEGERARGDGRFPDAIAAFNRAIEADSTFWLAYLRNYSTHTWMFYPYDTVLLRYRSHEAELPERDRAILAAGRVRGRTAAVAAFRAVAARYPDSWSAWEGSGDILFHYGAQLGIPIEQARADLERVVLLNPRWTEAWQHLLILGYRTSGVGGPGADSITRLMRGLGYDSASATTLGFGELQLYELSHRMRRDSNAIRSPLADSVFAGLRRGKMTDVIAALFPSFSLLFPGSGAASLQFSRHALQAGLSERDMAGHRNAIAWGWARRGAYDSALVESERLPSARPSQTTIHLSAIAEFSGAIPQAFESRWPRIDAALPSYSASQRAQMIALRGAVAVGRGDRAALDAALKELVATDSTSVKPYLMRELRALELAMDGQHTSAADSITVIEYEMAERGSPSTIAVMRGLASRWLQQAGKNDEAAKLLLWTEAFDPAAWIPSISYHPLAILERARLAEARGDANVAVKFFTEFLQYFDKPMPSLQPLVAEARAAVTRLSRKGG